MWMCINYRALNKKTIKNRYHNLRIDELLDELHGEIFFQILIFNQCTTISESERRIFPKLLSNDIMGIMSF